MVLRAHALLALALVLTTATCLDDPGFVCEADAQCVARDVGTCEPTGWCSYPDGTCDLGRRYGPFAPASIAETCVDTELPTTGEDSGGDGPPEPPASVCGNGIVDEREACDDGNRIAGDGCHPHCVLPGTVLWTLTYDAPLHSEDKAFGVAVDAERASFYVAGFATVMGEGKDILLQRRWIETGELVWSRTHGGDAHLDDLGEHVAIAPDGDPVIVGIEVTQARGGDIWVRRYDPEGEERWTVTEDIGPEDHAQGATVTPSGHIVVVGSIAVDRGDGVDTDAWLRRYDAAGAPLGEAVIRGSAGTGDVAIDTISDGDGFVVTGNLGDAVGEQQVWTASYGPDDLLRWEDLATQDPVGNAARGVGVAIDPTGGPATAGVLSNDIWLQRYDAAGTPGLKITVAGTGDRHDEAADIAFTGDGRFILVGFQNFATTGFATGDVWVRMYDPDGTELWTDIYDGPSEEIDKALAVELTDDHSAIVVGYETVPGQSRDAWMRRYAL